MSKYIKLLRFIAIIIALAASFLTTGCAGLGEFMVDLDGAMKQQNYQQQEAPRRTGNTSAYGTR